MAVFVFLDFELLDTRLKTFHLLQSRTQELFDKGEGGLKALVIDAFELVACQFHNKQIRGCQQMFIKH